MKKFVFLFVSFIFIAAQADAGEAEFFNALRNCSSYSGSGYTKTDGQLLKFNNKILGWEDDKCIYKEQVNYGGIDACINCKLTRQQINELVEVMNAYEKLQKYTKNKPDVSSLDAVKDNPVVNAWNKYLQDPNVCTLQMK